MTIFSIYSSRPFIHAFSFQILYLICNNKSQIRNHYIFNFSVKISMYVVMDSQKICKLILFCTDWKTTFTLGKQLSLSGNLVGKHDLLNAGGGGATCSRLKYQREQDEMRRERILSKVRPAPRIFALLKLPWGMRGLETKTYQMMQKNSIFEGRNTRFWK